MNIAGIAVAGLVACLPLAAAAGEAEQIDQLEPGKGEWQAEIFSALGKGEDEHALELMAGLSDRVAFGLEIEAETSSSGVSFEGVGPKLLYRFTRDGAPLGIGVQMQASIGRRASLSEAELRLLASTRNARWWTQANAMVRRSSDDGETSSRFAYAWSVQYAVGGIGWLGLEGSGRFLPFSGRTASPDHGHFLGPSLTLEIETGPDREIEFGVAALHQFDGPDPRSVVRVFAQFGF